MVVVVTVEEGLLSRGALHAHKLEAGLGLIRSNRKIPTALQHLSNHGKKKKQCVKGKVSMKTTE